MPSHDATARSTGPIIAAPDKIAVTLKVNGVEHRLVIAPWTSLLDMLRDHLD